MAERYSLTLPSSLDWIVPAVEYLRQRALLSGICDEGRAGKISLALHEALANAIIHGNLELTSDLKEEGEDAFAAELARRASDPVLSARAVRVEVLYDGDNCHWVLCDQGPGFDFETLLRRLDEPPTEEELLRPSGRGIRMMKAFVDDLRWDQGGRRVRLTLRRAPHREGRRHPRLPLRRRVQVAPLRPDGSVDWEEAHDAVARDLSAEGVGLLQESLARSERVLVGLDVEGRTLYLPADVRHCTPLAPGLVEIGCRFRFGGRWPPGEDERAAADALDALLDRVQVGSLPDVERREHPRVRYTERIVVTGPDGRSLPAFARDLSRGGIAFISSVPLPPEAATLTLPLPGRDPLRVSARVVRCSRIADGFFDVAARFRNIDD
jgi:anti-sigma regulatory factor (Ser/Thr protein kinase)